MFSSIPPQPAKKLLKVLRSASCFAELARISGTWEVSKMEDQIFGRHSRKTFISGSNGSLIGPQLIAQIQRLHPKTNLLICRRNPLGEILCDPSLTQDRILSGLDTMPLCPERSLIWKENVLGIFTGGVSMNIEMPDSLHMIKQLKVHSSPAALLALVGRMRLAQLRGNLENDIEYERAILEIIPTCVASCNGLYLGQHALITALMNFLKWKPFKDWRSMMEIYDNSVRELRDSVFERIQQEIRGAHAKGIDFPPDEQLKCRELLAIDATKNTKG